LFTSSSTTTLEDFVVFTSSSFVESGGRKVPSFRIAIITTMNGGKSNFQMGASTIIPRCQNEGRK
jgi:hypothetical protein